MNNPVSNFAFDFSLPTKIKFVPQNAETVLEEIKSNGIQNVGVIVDTNAKSQPLVEKFLGAIDKIIRIEKLVSYIGGEPTYDALEDVREKFHSSNINGIFAIGGGSVMDLGKGLAVLLKNPGPALKYRGFNHSNLSSIPIVTVPTIAGTGSEITPNASFVDNKEKKKLGINGECVRPSYAIIDPSFTLSCPYKALLSSATDSVVHATEAFVSKNATFISQFFAKEAFRLVCTNLESLKDRENSLSTRCDLAIGSLFAALAMIHSGSGPAAAMSYPLGVHYEIPHGFAGGIFLPFVSKVTQKASCFIHDELIKGIAPSDYSFSDYILSIWKQVGIPLDLEKMGLTPDQDEMFINETLKLSGALDQHPTPFGKEEIKEVLQCIREVEI